MLASLKTFRDWYKHPKKKEESISNTNKIQKEKKEQETQKKDDSTIENIKEQDRKKVYEDFIAKIENSRDSKSFSKKK